MLSILQPGRREGAAMVQEAVTAYSDPGKQTTIDEIVKLAAANVPTLIGKLKEKG